MFAVTQVFEKSLSVILPAGGIGIRFGGDVKKQFLKLRGETVLNRTIEAFLAIPEVTLIVVALPEDEIDAQARSLAHDKVAYVRGGANRAESVRRGFAALQNLAEDAAVLVHDAVRPLVSAELIRRVAAGATENGTALPVVTVTDTIKKIEAGRVTATVDRSSLGAAQTPQGARYDVFKKAYAVVGTDLSAITDEAMLWEKAGIPVFTVEGERENVKVTTPFDLKMAEAILEGKAR